MSEQAILFEEFTYPSSDGENTVHACLWMPDGKPPRAVIQLAHGMCEYVKRYDAWARCFAAEGYALCGNDHLGHGETAKNEADLGFTAPRSGANLLVEDVYTLTKMMKERFPDAPIVLYGHSMGSFVARAYLARHGEALSAAIISGTAGPEQPAGLARRLAHAIAAVKGDRHRSKLLTSLAFGAYNKKFPEDEGVNAWLSRDPAVRESYAKDPYCTFVFTAAGYDTLFSLLVEVSDKRWAEKLPKSLPVLLFSGDMDPVGNYGKGVRAVYERMQKAGCSVRLKLYENGRHEMHNEQNRDEVFSDLLSYLEDVLV